MKYKIICLVLLALLTVGAIAEFTIYKTLMSYFWGFTAGLSWLLLILVKLDIGNKKSDEDEHDKKIWKGIPGYEKSGKEIRGCYNCSFSRDIGNNTFVECIKFQKKVYRNYACDEYRI